MKLPRSAAWWQLAFGLIITGCAAIVMSRIDPLFPEIQGNINAVVGLIIGFFLLQSSQVSYLREEVEALKKQLTENCKDPRPL